MSEKTIHLDNPMGDVLIQVKNETFSIDRITKLRGYLYAVLVVAFCFQLLSSYSLSWIILTVITAGLAARAFFASSRDHEKSFFARLVGPAFIVAVLSFVCIFFGSSINTFAFNTLKLPPSAEVRPSWSGTFDVARGTMQSGAKKTVLGAGPSRFFTEWDKYHPTEVNLTQWWNVDFNNGVGMIPESLVTVGFVGFLLWVIFFTLFLILGVRALSTKIAEENKITKFLLLSSFSGTLFLLAVFICNVPSSTIVALAFILTGIFTVAMAEIGMYPLKTVRYSKDPKRGFVAVILLVVLLGGVIYFGFNVIQRYQSVISYRNAVLSKDFNQAEAQINHAISLSKDDSYFRSYSILSNYQANQVLASKTLKADDIRTQWNAMFRSAVNNAKNAIVSDGQNYVNWVVLGNTYAALVPLEIPTISADAYASAIVSYQKAQTLSPKNPGILYALASVSISNKKQDDAVKYLKGALDLKNNYSDALALLTQIDTSDGGDPKEAVNYLKKALSLAPSDPTLLFQLGFAYFKSGDYKNAATALETSTSLVPNYANAEYFLGLTYSKLGRVKDAIKQMESVKSTNPDRTDITTIISNLQHGYPPLSSVASAQQTPAQNPASAPTAPKKPTAPTTPKTTQ